MSPDARQLIAQHAKTTQLLGVDFLPLGDAPRTLVADQPSSTIEPKPIPELAQTPPPSLMPEPDASTSVPTVPLTELRSASEKLPDAAARLEALSERYQSDSPHQHFNNSFTNIVFGEGAPDADLMFIGEAPGEQEDLTGRPFVGRAGQLLEKMIVAMGYSRETVYICNVLKTRPPNNATPTSEEARLCAPYLLEQIRIIAPKIIVTLGLPASHLLLGSTSPMRSLRGQFHAFPPTASPNAIIAQDHVADFPSIEVMPTYHPAYLLRSYTEENRRKVWSDLQQVMTKLKPE
jgi:uracil-DNA glycosylase family 4